jgi:5'-3' exonuclease
VEVHLVDGTYELFRYFFALPSHENKDGREVAATRGVLGSVLFMLEEGATHVGVATDHVIESFRNDLWPGYKTGEGIDPRLFQQFPLLEEGLQKMGVMTWPMVELEADDALASAALQASESPEVERVFICSPDKDLAQCVRGNRVVQLVRRTGAVLDEAAVVAKFGVPPESIPDYLALVGDSADGYPGLSGWGRGSTAPILRRYGSIEAIPADVASWESPARGAANLARTLRADRDRALLFKQLATLRTDADVFDDIGDLKWRGPRDGFSVFCEQIDAPQVLERAERLAKTRAGRRREDGGSVT